MLVPLRHTFVIKYVCAYTLLGVYIELELFSLWNINQEMQGVGRLAWTCVMWIGVCIEPILRS